MKKKMQKQDIENFTELNDTIHYSGYFIHKTPEYLQKWIAQQFSSSSSIKSLKKKKEIQSMLEYLSKFIENVEEPISFQFFMSPEKFLFFHLQNSQINTIQKYLKKDDYLSTNLQKDFWIDLYFNEDFTNVYEPLPKKDSWVLQHYYFTKTKFEQRDRIPEDNREYITKFKPQFYIKTKQNAKYPEWDKITYVDFPNGNNVHMQLIESFCKYQQEKNEKYMVSVLGGLERNPDLFVFGNDVIKEIRNYGIKEIFCYTKYKNKIEKNIPKEFLNFKWITFDDNMQISQLEQFRGIFGKKYFS